MDPVEAERLLIKNSLVTGHFLVAWAMLVNVLHLGFFHDRLSMAGLAAGGLALFAAWLLPAIGGESRSLAGFFASCFTLLSWIIAIVAI